MQNIQDYLRTVYGKLKEYYESHPDEQDGFSEDVEDHLKKGIGEYEIPYIYVYTLRYALAYGFEYSRIYKAILDKMNTDRISVTSVGAGTGVDYWGLCYAAEKMLRCPVNVSYTGIEPAREWGECRFEQRESDAFAFPDNTDNFRKLLDRLKADELPLDDVYIAFAYRAWPGTWTNGFGRVDGESDEIQLRKEQEQAAYL